MLSVMWNKTVYST